MVDRAVCEVECTEVRQWKTRRTVVGSTVATSDGLPAGEYLVIECQFNDSHGTSLILRFPDPLYIPAVGDKFNLTLTPKE